MGGGGGVERERYRGCSFRRFLDELITVKCHLYTEVAGMVVGAGCAVQHILWGGVVRLLHPVEAGELALVLGVPAH